MKERVISLLVVVSLVFLVFGAPFLFSSFSASERALTEGTALGAESGAALVDKKNSWLRAIIGGSSGGAFEGTVTEISQKAVMEAAAEGRPIVYQSVDGSQRVEATPLIYDAEAKCHKVRERIWQESKLVKNEVKKVCQSEKTGSGQ